MKLKPGKDFIGIGVFALILNNKNQILLLKRHSKNYWERPGGKIEYGEDIFSALKREVLEETGVHIKTINRLNNPIYINEEINSKEHWIGLQYFVHYKKGIAKIMEPKKYKLIKWFNIDNLPKTHPTTKKVIQIYNSKFRKYT
jgi:ADP-ribose pyrophosphatase YjhB (NUDIX family)